MELAAFLFGAFLPDGIVEALGLSGILWEEEAVEMTAARSRRRIAPPPT